MNLMVLYQRVVNCLPQWRAFSKHLYGLTATLAYVRSSESLA